jgi:threonine/homoserine/homoserine lactone efflux protein
MAASSTYAASRTPLMPKALCMVGMAVAIILVLLFLLDLVAGIPFRRASMMMDILMLVCAAMLAYVSWSTFREQA